MSSGRKQNTIDLDVVRQLAEVLVGSGLTEIECAGTDWRIRLSRQPAGAAAGAPSSLLPSPAERDDSARTEGDDGITGHAGLLTSPMVGIVYTAPEPTAAPFVSVGDTVAAGDTVLLIEAMKVFNPIKAHRAGRIERIFVTGGTPVEYGEPLLLIA